MNPVFLKQLVADAVDRKFGVIVKDVVVESAQTNFGDYSSNISFSLAKELKRSPREIAQELANVIVHEDIQRVEAAGAGFLNFTLTNRYWQKQLQLISPDYAKNNLGNNRTVQVEFISANPTGPTTIGNARGGFIGDVLSRVLAWSGYAVTREYYFNNAGTQISKLLESVKMAAGIIPETTERQYRGEYIDELASMFAVKLKSADDTELKVLITDEILRKYIRPAVEAMGITFDVWFNEDDLIKDGRFETTINKLRQLNLVSVRDGATWLATGQLGDDRGERVIIKSTGDPTYLAPDLAYHDDIFGRRQFNISIKVLGPDHVAQFPSVLAATRAIHPNADLRLLLYQGLRLVKDGQEVKVSKRLGQFVTVQDLITEVSLPVARYLMLMRSADSHIDFDLGLAQEESAKNPYYYAMYAYVRAGSLLMKARSQGLLPADNGGSLSIVELQLIKCMALLPELVETVAGDFGVHRLTFYAQDLARIFQEYYEGVRIIDLPKHEAGQKLYVVQQFQTVMNVVWQLLGIEPLEKLSNTALVE